MSNIESQFSVTTTNQMKIPSVFDGDIPFISFRTENGVTVGKLMGKGGILSFEGNCDESAKLFFDGVIKLNQELLHSPDKNLLAALLDLMYAIRTDDPQWTKSDVYKNAENAIIAMNDNQTLQES